MEKFNNIIDNAKIASTKSNYMIEDHFSQVGKMIELAKCAKRTMLDYNYIHTVKKESNIQDNYPIDLIKLSF